jgi:A/G-specific adenine glycosylase
MLQQTRVAQGLPYYLKFTEAFPTIFDLANASEEEVLKLWQGLGYYSRARNLHQTAKYIAFELNGEFPSDYIGLLQLKGIGEYTAAAIASFAYNESVPVVDGNVFRVLARFFDVETDIAKASAKKEFTELARLLLPEGKANVFNQAIMEFGALQCVPKNPDCQGCVLNEACLALKNNKVAALPVKLKRTKIHRRFFDYVIFSDENGKTLINKRLGKGIWHNLYEFPLIEFDESVDEDTVFETICGQEMVKNKLSGIHLLNDQVIVHKLSHQHLFIRFWKVEAEGELEGGISFESVLTKPFPIVIYNFISDKHSILSKKVLNLSIK